MLGHLKILILIFHVPCLVNPNKNSRTSTRFVENGDYLRLE